MSDEQSHEHEHHAVNYTAIFVVLCVCTLISIVLDVSKEHLPYAALVALILAVAVSKATFVLLYFMHIKFETAWKYVLLAPTGVLACALPFALAPDIAFHYYNVAAPQRALEAAEHEGEHGAGGHAPAVPAPDTHAAEHADHKDAPKHDPTQTDEHTHKKGDADHKPKAPADKVHK